MYTNIESSIKSQINHVSCSIALFSIRLNRPIVHHFIFDHVAMCKPLWYEIMDANWCKLFINSWKKCMMDFMAICLTLNSTKCISHSAAEDELDIIDWLFSGRSENFRSYCSVIYLIFMVYCHRNNLFPRTIVLL